MSDSIFPTPINSLKSAITKSESSGLKLRQSGEFRASIDVERRWWRNYTHSLEKYNQQFLEKSLLVHWKLYRPSLILNRAIHYRNWTAVSIVRKISFNFSILIYAYK